jgi:hypothetical protein
VVALFLSGIQAEWQDLIIVSIISDGDTSILSLFPPPTPDLRQSTPHVVLRFLLEVPDKFLTPSLINAIHEPYPG